MPMHDWTRVSAGTFHNFHVLWTGTITNRLNAGLLPAGFFAMAEQIVGRPEGDVVAFRNGSSPKQRTVPQGGVQATLVKPKTSFVLPAAETRYANKANRIAVKHELGRVVAVIEIVSPGNKGSHYAIRTFVEKTAELLHQGVNLLILDPFPPGPRDPQGIHREIWNEVEPQPFELPSGKPLTFAAYEAAPITTAYVEPIAVGDPLPEMPLFLFEDTYINVPLEETYQATWDVLPVELRGLIESPA